MVPNGGIWCQMVSKKRICPRNFVQKFVFLRKTFLLQKEKFIKTFFKELMTKRDKKNEIIMNPLQNNFGFKKIKLKKFR